MPSEPTLLLDACAAINILASGAPRTILDALPYEAAVAPLVLEHEVLYVNPDTESSPLPQEEGPAEPEGMNLTLQPLVDEGLIQVLRLEGEAEHTTYVDLALELDDGEAMTGALAIHRNAHIATDDRKAIRILGERLSSNRIVRTTELVKSWFDGGADPDAVREALREIQTQGSFVPPRSDPLAGWWERFLE